LFAGFLVLAAAKPSRNLPDTTLLNDEGKEVKLSSLKDDDEILVLIFVASTCPVTSGYWERIKGIWYNYRDRDVRLVLVGGNSDDSAAKIRTEIEREDLELPIVWDDQHALAGKLGAEYTPEAVVLGREWGIMYRGRIDDSWRDESRVRERHLDKAVTAALDGKKSPDRIDERFMGSHMR